MSETERNELIAETLMEAKSEFTRRLALKRQTTTTKAKANAR
jgi:O-succinylbenzoate synthase